jgi:hypothetical protein
MSNYKGDDRLEQHFTTGELIDELYDLLDRHYKGDITELLENSAGDGRIVDKWVEKYNKPYLAFDIEPKRSDIKEANYLKEKIEYKAGRICVINPPFQSGLRFLNKAIKESDYVVAILSQNSLLNIDYDTIWVDEIQLWRKYDFITCKAGVILVACRKKLPTDKYEYE